MARLPRFWSGALLAIAASIAAPLAQVAQAAPAATPRNSDLAPAIAKRDKDHKHVWVTKNDKKWVPPVMRKEQVGTDANGKPIYKDVVVQPGYWKTISSTVCSVCGKKKN